MPGKYTGDFKNQKYAERLYTLIKPENRKTKGLIICCDYSVVDEIIKNIINNCFTTMNMVGDKFNNLPLEMPTRNNAIMNGHIIDIYHELGLRDKIKGKNYDWYLWISNYPIDEILDTVNFLVSGMRCSFIFPSNERGNTDAR